MRFILSYILFVLGFSFGEAQVNEKYLDSAFSNSSSFTSYEIKFEFDKPQLRAESHPYLDSMAVYLIKHDSLIIEVQNHRDSRGSDLYGSNLTQRRAQAVVDYLIKKGVDESRLVAKGYGESMPVVNDFEINSNKSKEEQESLHQKNRRTVFKIISGGK